MSSTVSTRECPICLEKLRKPVVTPCGHLTCEQCISTHIRSSSHRCEATCPTCRAPFPTVPANLSTIPRKYHVFISPPLRRVYLADTEDNNRAVIDGIISEITNLKSIVVALHSDYCRAQDEAKEARVALDKAKEETRLANQRLEDMRAAYDALKSRGMDSSLRVVTNTKRTSGQAGLDNSPSKSIESSSHEIDFPFKDRFIRPLPKRTKRQSMESLPDDSPSKQVGESFAKFMEKNFSSLPEFPSSWSTLPTWPDTIAAYNNTLPLASHQAQLSAIANRATPETST